MIGEIIRTAITSTIAIALLALCYNAFKELFTTEETEKEIDEDGTSF